MPVGQLIRDVKAALVEAGFSSTSVARVAQVASVQLVLDLVAEKSGGGGVNFCVPFIGTRLSLKAKRSNRDVHSIDLTIVPPSQPDDGYVLGGNMQDALVHALGSVRQALTAAAGGQDPWVLSAGTVEISFGVTSTGSISLIGEGDLSDEVTQKLRLALEPVAPPAGAS
jgi:hypothetical protein